MAIDGILIGARDYRYLAVTCTLTAVVYVTLILILANIGDAGADERPDAYRRTLGRVQSWCSWVGRGLSNGLRVRSDAWMR